MPWLRCAVVRAGKADVVVVHAKVDVVLGQEPVVLTPTWVVVT